MSDQYPLSDDNVVLVGFPVLEVTPIEANPTRHPHLITNAVRGDNWDLSVPDEETQFRIQEILAIDGLYEGRVNGKWGNLSVYSIGKAVGTPVAAPNFELCVAIQDFAVEYGEYDGDTFRKGFLTPELWSSMADGLEKRAL